MFLEEGKFSTVKDKIVIHMQVTEDFGLFLGVSREDFGRIV